MGFETPSDIQEKAIPQIIDGERDFIGLAQTGTGKTAAFGLPLLDRIDPDDPATQALILAPTRELGRQIAEQLNKFSKYQKRVNVLAVYGGAAISQQIRALRKPQHVIIATPGRLIDLIQRKSVNLEELDLLVLDEADEMLTMGFKDEIDKILSYAPDTKKTWLFSATMSNDIRKIVNTYMTKPIEVKINAKQKVNTDIEHQFAIVRGTDKTEALTRFLDAEPEMRAVVFCRTKRDTQQLADDLFRKKYKADALHGDLSQRIRDRVMARFKNNDVQILIATDVAARGIDVNDLTHVFHFALPDDLEYYTHRSGRTGRAGKKGTSISFIGGREKYKIDRLQKQLDIYFQKVLVPTADDIYEQRIEGWCHQVVDREAANTLSPKLLRKALTLFGELSKEELIEKILLHELEKFSYDGSGRDLNETFKKPTREERMRNRGGGSGYNRSGNRDGRRRKRSYGDSSGNRSKGGGRRRRDRKE